jgi:hypothetical protein
LGTEQKADRGILIRITQLQEMTMMLRQNMTRQAAHGFRDAPQRSFSEGLL